jgi:site-specific DNA-methyltransferase (adenine-specific)/adenine-specific DNA-methyltransferase
LKNEKRPDIDADLTWLNQDSSHHIITLFDEAYPAQLKETYGEPVEGWTNRIFWGDNLQVMSHLLKEFRGSIKLIYIDPPFDSKAEYRKKISLKGTNITNEHNAFEEKQYTDIWTNDEYLQFMYERLILIRELLSDDGSFYLHCDYRKSHHLRCLVDEVFGSNRINNEIVWFYRRWTAGSNTFQKMHDTLIFVSKTNAYTFNKIYVETTEGQKRKHEKGWDRNSVYIDGVRKPQLIVYDKTKVDDAIKQGKININEYARVVNVEVGKTIAPDVWQINYINSQAQERLNYPTQKPEELLDRIIRVSTNPGDLVFDCFMGSGTAQAVAMKLGRKFIGNDINLGAVQITSKRLLSISKEIQSQSFKRSVAEGGDNNPCYTGFSVYNVNHYDVFRNPSQAKDLLIEALEIQPLQHNAIFDGEKDGRMVKIMPVNRIATRADLNELLSNFDYKTFEKRKTENPNKAVENILLVCMGHEQDLAGTLEKEAGYKLNVEIVDILRDKSNLEFKRDSEASVVINNGDAVIQSFYPMNLLQKLSLMKENVEDWRELVESVMIDWNYDGETLRPGLSDIPGKNELVKGIYPLPKKYGNIRVKITDLLSESWEGEAQNG